MAAVQGLAEGATAVERSSIAETLRRIADKLDPASKTIPAKVPGPVQATPVTAAQVVAAAKMAQAQADASSWWAQAMGGEAKVFVSEVYDLLASTTRISLVAFKALLRELHERGELVMSRCDLVEAAPRELVERSHTPCWADRPGDLCASWHFIRVEV